MPQRTEFFFVLLFGPAAHILALRHKLQSDRAAHHFCSGPKTARPFDKRLANAHAMQFGTGSGCADTVQLLDEVAIGWRMRLAVDRQIQIVGWNKFDF